MMACGTAVAAGPAAAVTAGAESAVRPSWSEAGAARPGRSSAEYGRRRREMFEVGRRNERSKRERKKKWGESN
jgi:hypothetical protein